MIRRIPDLRSTRFGCGFCLLAAIAGCERESRTTTVADATPAANETVAAKRRPDSANASGNDSMKAKLIPRDVLFGNPQRAQARLSPDGKYLSFVAPVDGVLNVWVGPANDMSKAKPVTQEKVRPVRSHNWTYDSKHILYPQDTNGNENFHLFATNVETGETKDLTPIDGVRAELQEVSEKFPKEILVGLNDRDKQLHDIWKSQHRHGREGARAAEPGRGRLSDR